MRQIRCTRFEGQIWENWWHQDVEPLTLRLTDKAITRDVAASKNFNEKSLTNKDEYSLWKYFIGTASWTSVEEASSLPTTRRSDEKILINIYQVRAASLRTEDRRETTGPEICRYWGDRGRRASTRCEGSDPFQFQLTSYRSVSVTSCVSGLAGHDVNWSLPPHGAGRLAARQSGLTS